MHAYSSSVVPGSSAHVSFTVHGLVYVLGSVSVNVCSIDDNDFFIRGCLDIPVIGSADTFSWGVWCSVSRVNFATYREVFDEPLQSHVGPFFGWFSVRLPGYPDTLNLKVMAHLRDQRMRPAFELEESGHPLSIECRQGISAERLQEIYEANLHAGPIGPP